MKEYNINIAIVLAGGTGSRFKSNIPKQLLKVKNKTILEYSIETFINSQNIDKIIVVMHKNFIKNTKEIFDNNKWHNIEIIEGGNIRQESVYNALNFIKQKIKKDKINVLIHDGARPLFDKKDLEKLINNLKTNMAISLAVPNTDTLIQINLENMTIKAVPPRKEYWKIQTPQCFNFDIIYKAHSLAKKENFNSATDDTSLILKYTLANIKVIESSNTNMKITHSQDLKLFENNL